MTKNLLAKLYPLALTAGIAGLGYILSHPILFGFCIHRYQFSTYTGCSDASISGVGLPLLAFASWWLFAIATIVIFLPYAIFKSWLKFAACSLPLAFIFVALTPVSATRAGIDFFPYYRVNAAHDAGVAFLVLSLLFIGWKLYRRRQFVKNSSQK